jgi:AcrR family transcriptional regulator
MHRTRSRSKTKEKFLQAVLDLIADKGCGALGVNAVAQQTGADKVLIYRYFTNLDGLLQEVAEQREWLPSVSQIISSVAGQSQDSQTALRQIAKLLVHHIQTDPTTLQLVHWRKAMKNPLTNHFTTAWHRLWRELPKHLAKGLGYDQRASWEQACALTALVVEAELTDEAISTNALDAIAADLVLGDLPRDEAEFSKAMIEDVLPTNLL